MNTSRPTGPISTRPATWQVTMTCCSINIAARSIGTTRFRKASTAPDALLGERTPFVHVPYFFSDVFDLSYEFWGDPSGADEIVERGDMSSSSFSVWWLRQGRLAAAFVMNRPEEEREAAPRLIQSKELTSAATLPGSASEPFAGTQLSYRKIKMVRALFHAQEFQPRRCLRKELRACDYAWALSFCVPAGKLRSHG